jgi:Flp pilus assembly pilin Flp
MKLQALLVHLVVDDRGQDLVEYGLLAAIIGIAGILVFPQIEAAMDAAYSTWADGAYDQWCPDDPGGVEQCSEEEP